MEIESMVANSALVRARAGGGNKGRSYRWREMLRFPHITQCVDLAMNIERDYRSLCLTQPIGKNLFQLFCRSRPDLLNHVLLWEALEAFETKADEERRDFGLRIICDFLLPQSRQLVSIMSKHLHSCQELLDQNPYRDVFKACREDLHRHLGGEPFQEYQSSMFFDRFLQWKMLERQPITKHDFRQYRLLGKGGFGEVWACQVRATGMMYACKKLEKTHVKKRKCESMALNEKQILESLHSRFVVNAPAAVSRVVSPALAFNRCRGRHPGVPQVNLACAYETKHALCMVLTMMSGGDLRYHIYNLGEPGLDHQRVAFYAAEVCCGLVHLHQKSIVYRDLKPENILLDDNGHIRISDLGLAVRLGEEKVVRGRVGTLGYMAPEVMAHDFYGTSADWWGLGCLIYEMTAGEPPLRARGERPSTPEMQRRTLGQRLQFGDKFGAAAKDVCSQLLAKYPERRLGCRAAGWMEVQSHRFFKSINFRMLEAGLVEPPFKPDPRLVYCSDVYDIDEFSAVRGVVLNQLDSHFYSEFNTGRVATTWQNELIETGCYAELNTFGPEGSRTVDLDWSKAPMSPKRGLFRRIFRKHHHSDASDESRQNLVSNEGPMSSVLD